MPERVWQRAADKFGRTLLIVKQSLLDMQREACQRITLMGKIRDKRGEICA